MSRALKHIAFGILYLAIFSGIGWSAYLLFLKAPASCVDQIQNQSETDIDCGGGCVSCEIKQLTPIIVGRPALIRSGDIVTVTAPLENMNLVYGAEQFRYTLTLFDSNGNIIKAMNKTSFIHAGERTQFTETGILDARQQIVRAEIAIDTIDWKSTDEWWQPALTAKEVRTEFDGDRVLVKGIVVNTNNFIIAQAVINAAVVNAAGAIIGASGTTLETMQPFEEREFQITVAPEAALIGAIAPEATELFVSARK